MKKTIISILALAVLGLTNIQAQQLKVPVPSPSQTVKQSFGL
jgi:hypothetical protein